MVDIGGQQCGTFASSVIGSSRARRPVLWAQEVVMEVHYATEEQCL